MKASGLKIPCASKLSNILPVMLLLFAVAVMLPFYWGITAKSLYLAAAAMIYLLLRGLRDGVEVKLLVFFGVWMLLSRMLNGDLFITNDTAMTLSYCVMFVFVGAGIMLSRENRQKALGWVSAVYCGFYTLLGVVCVVTGIFQLEIIESASGIIISAFGENHSRMTILNENPNYTAFFYYFSFSLLVWQFFRYKKRPVRAVIILAMLINYLVIMYTFSRNVKLAFSICLGMLFVLLALQRVKTEDKRLRALVIVGLMCVVVPLAYKSFDAATHIANSISEVVVRDQDVVSQDSTSADSDDVFVAGDGRAVFEDTGRLLVYKSALEVLRDNPKRLLIGSLDVMGQTNEYCFMEEVKSGAAAEPGYEQIYMMHHHCSYLQVLMHTGLPGFLLFMAFMLLLAMKIVRVYFSKKLEIHEKTLSITLTGVYFYNVLESSLFYKIDFCSTMFFILAGMVIAFSKEADKA